MQLKEDMMATQVNKNKMKKFFFRRRINLATLLVITLLSVAVTVICRITGFIPGRMIILELVSLLLIVLCVVQTYRMRSSFRTIKDFKGKPRKRKAE